MMLWNQCQSHPRGTETTASAGLDTTHTSLWHPVRQHKPASPHTCRVTIHVPYCVGEPVTCPRKRPPRHWLGVAPKTGAMDMMVDSSILTHWQKTSPKSMCWETRFLCCTTSPHITLGWSVSISVDLHQTPGTGPLPLAWHSLRPPHSAYAKPLHELHLFLYVPPSQLMVHGETCGIVTGVPGGPATRRAASSSSKNLKDLNLESSAFPSPAQVNAPGVDAPFSVVFFSTNSGLL